MDKEKGPSMDAFIATGNTKKFDLPIGYLDFDYIGKCEDVKMLEKIFKVLKSGDEGCFPQLEQFCEDRIRELNPKSRTLRKDDPLKTKAHLDAEERTEMDEDLKNWTSNMKYVEENISTPEIVTQDETETDLPPIRSGAITITTEGKKSSSNPAVNPNKRVMPRDYREWDKVDVEKELEKVDDDDSKVKERSFVANKEVTNIPDTVDTKGLTDSEKLMKANREKDKGNEAFRANDFKEAIVYYSRSISLQPTAASYNNRALAYLKSTDWNKAVSDTNTVLQIQPNNVKALLRRGTAYKGLKQYEKAKHNLSQVIQREPNNKKAQELVVDIDKLIEKEKAERKKKGRRMVIEDVEEEVEEMAKGDNSNVTGKGSNSNVTGKGSNSNVTGKGGDSPKKQSRRMEIQEVDSDEEGDEEIEEIVVDKPEVKEELKLETTVNGHVTELEKEVVVNGHPEPDSDTDIKNKHDQSNKTNSKKTDVENQKVKIKSTEKLLDDKSVDKVKDSVSNDNKTRIETEVVSDQESKNKTVVNNNTNSAETDEQKLAGNAKTDNETQEAKPDSKEPAPHFKRPVFYMREFPKNVVPVREEANALFKQGQYGVACEGYSKVIKLLEKVPDQIVNLSLMYSNRAACQLKIGDLSSCVKDCNESLKLIPHSVKPLLRRAIAYEHLESHRNAYKDYRHVLLLDTRMDQAHLGTKRCQQLLHQKDGPSWREKFKFPSVNPWDVPEIIGLDGHSTAPVVFNNPANGQSQPSSQTNQSPSSLASQSKTSTNPATTKTEEKKKTLSPQQKFDELKNKGNECVKKGNFREAIEHYSKCVDILPDQAVSYTNRSLCYIRINQADKAEADCTIALKLEKTNVKALFRRAQARKMLKHYRDGIEDLKHLLEIDSKNAAAIKEMELLKKYWREELQNMRNQPSKTESKTSTQSGAAPAGSSSTGDTKVAGKQKKRMVIQEVDSEEEPVITQTSAGKSKSKENIKPAEKQKQPTKPKIQEVKTSEPVKKTTESASKPVQKSDTKGNNSSAKGNNSTAKGNNSSKPAHKKNDIRETSSGFQQVPINVPKLEKATPYEFISIWNSFKKSQTVKPYYELLKQISPSDIKTVISNKLDGPMLNIITRCVSEHYLQNGEEDESYSILKNLSAVPRFGTVTMFMSAKEKSEIESVMTSLESHSSTVYSPADIHKLQKDYGV